MLEIASNIDIGDRDRGGPRSRQCKDESPIHPAIATAIAIVLCSSGVASILADADPCSGVVRSGSERRSSPSLDNQTLRQGGRGDEVLPRER
jgi:hypothetical protein